MKPGTDLSPSKVWKSYSWKVSEHPFVWNDTITVDSHKILKEPLLCKGLHGTDNSVDSAAYYEEDRDLHLNSSSSLQALLNGMNVLAGVGVLSTPYALAQGGWLGLGFLLLFALVCCYTGFLLRRCLETDSRMSSYPDIGDAAFGRAGRLFVSTLLYFELFAVAVEFLILEGDNLARLFPRTKLNIASITIPSHQVFIIVSALAMLPTVWLRKLSLLSFLSAGGVLASILVLLAVGWVGIFDGVGFHCRGKMINLSGLPVAIGLYSFCYCGHAVFPNIYASMKKRERFSAVLLVCFTLCTFIYGCIGVLGYLMFGDDLKSQITLNLPTDKLASKVAIYITLVNPFAKYALTLSPVAMALEELLPSSLATQKHVFWGTCVRTMLVAATVIVALAVPMFGYLMAFIGSFLSNAVAVIFPCLCYLKIFRFKLSAGEASFVQLILGLGILSGCIGTYSSLKQILEGLG
ncbi:hypothetical protein O6H91_14G042600 [Diphasiastrum complanatum]|uniref:Uncharacterized protein n=1 Tax=Diphasiastrum complanatum TaxID=34168 RepID=A0ACC2BNY4_DIPCM|nr:hypothetical protein O6H91_14G042600 [Diphasiastrum complanatum]